MASAMLPINDETTEFMPVVSFALVPQSTTNLFPYTLAPYFLSIRRPFFEVEVKAIRKRYGNQSMFLRSLAVAFDPDWGDWETSALVISRNEHVSEQLADYITQRWSHAPGRWFICQREVEVIMSFLEDELPGCFRYRKANPFLFEYSPAQREYILQHRIWGDKKFSDEDIDLITSVTGSHGKNALLGRVKAPFINHIGAADETKENKRRRILAESCSSYIENYSPDSIYPDD